MTWIRELKKRSLALFRKCWAEMAFISLLQMGIFLLVYSAIMILGMATETLETSGIIPRVKSLPPEFVIGSLIIVLIYYISTAPLMLGIRWYYWHAAEGNVMPVSSVFAGYHSTEYALSLIKLKAFTDMRRLTPTLICAAFIAASVSVSQKLLTYPMSDGAAFTVKLACGLICAGLLAALLMSQMKYIPVGFLLADNPDLGTEQIISFSKKIVSQSYGYMILMYASFAGWYILCFAGFPVLALIPYLYMTTAVFINESIERLNSETKSEDSEKESQKENAPVG